MEELKYNPIDTQDSATLVQQWTALQKKREANPELYALRSTGLAPLDNILGGGIEYGQFVLYGGAQKAGKSTLLQMTAQSFAERGDPFIFFSAEMTNMAIATRLFSNVANIDKTKIRQIGLTKHDWARLDEAGKIISKYPGYWNYGFSTIDHVKNTIRKIYRETKEKTGTGVFVRTIFIDYIQLMEYSGQKARQEQLSALSRSFKRMCAEFFEPMIVIAAVQLNRQSIRGNIVDANSFLGTGAFERDMDIGVIIHESRDDITDRVAENERMITVVGSRDTDVGTCTVRFNGATATIKAIREGEAELDLDSWNR